MKRFVYDKGRYRIQITAPGILTIVTGVYGLVEYASTHNVLWIFVAVASIYNVWNTFVSLSNPEKVEWDKDSITFYAYGRKRSYKISEIKHFHLHPFAQNARMYLTLDKGGFHKGRYWIRIESFDHKEELVEQLYKTQEKIAPDSIMVRARKKD